MSRFATSETIEVYANLLWRRVQSGEITAADALRFFKGRTKRSNLTGWSRFWYDIIVASFKLAAVREEEE